MNLYVPTLLSAVWLLGETGLWLAFNVTPDYGAVWIASVTAFSVSWMISWENHDAK